MCYTVDLSDYRLREFTSMDKTIPQEVFALFADSQPTTIMSMGRNISYRKSPDSEKPDAIFEMMFVWRDEPNIDPDVLAHVIGMAGYLWRTTAINYLEGETIYDDEVDVRAELGARPSAPFVSVFGTIRDKERAFNLTITDQSTRESANRMIAIAPQLWDWVTDELSEGDNHNKGGKKDRSSKIGGEIRKPMKAVGKKGSNSGAKGSKSTGQAKEIADFNELKGLEGGTAFIMPASKLEVLPDKVLINGFIIDADGNIKPSSENVYMFKAGMDGVTRPEFLALQAIYDTGDVEWEYDSGVKVSGVKRIAKSGNPYYTGLAISIGDN